ncbi:amino acid ABC transporter permease [Treponema zuelzerae]|uniref:Amino acid ABC transporter permease n=1 Tax=Teretinema zuelzerae TaxID=156 RepID=A0AAE3ELE2_9SPIR|nr:amino acid ABC transporter permease [Teretinema zuelzerae]MCD1655534.1 amino acid ABC transporter permease [Teretinema zuelzerae]
MRTLDIQFMLKTFYRVLEGVPTTLGITLVALLVSMPAAFFFSLARIYRTKGFNNAVAVYVSFARSTPIVLQILIAYSLLPSFLNAVFTGFGLSIDVFSLNPVWYAYAVFSFNTTAVLTEVFRSALGTVDKGQLEAGLAAGLSASQAYRRIIVPQALLAALPNLCNAATSLLKSTSLAFMMTVREVTAIAKIEASYGYNYIEAYLDIFLIYVVLCAGVQLVFDAAEKRLGKHRLAGRKYA